MALRRKSSIAGMQQQSRPLLKFDDDKAFLHQDGLDLIHKAKGPIYPIILMGDGRAGKSYLASRFLNVEEVFISSDSAESVTEGIDVVMCPMFQLMQGLEGVDATADAAKPPEERMTAMVLDCEGGNNAMAAIRTLVNVFGILIGTEVLYVAGGSFSEASISNLGASLAARSLVKLGDGSKLQSPKLVFVVNKNTLKYKDDTLEKSLKTEQKDAGRRDNRNIILDTFSEREFNAIPLIGFPDFEDQITKLKQTIVKDARPLEVGGTAVKGEQLCGLLQLIVEQMSTMNEVSFPSMSRYVIFEGFLKPLAERLSKEAEEKLPELTDYDPELEKKDPRPAAVESFSAQVAHISETSLVEEGKQFLIDRITAHWDNMHTINEAMGTQTKETKTETKEIFGAEKKVPVGGKGLLAKVQLKQQTVRVETRTVIFNKKGEMREEPWVDSGRTAMRIVETAFQNFSKEVPSVFGRLGKKSPSVFQTIISFGGKFQERRCIVKEGHLIWWDQDRIKTPDHEVSGAINLLINHAAVEEDPDSQFTFTIKPSPKVGKWNDPASFSGGHNRELTFSVEGMDKSREAWVDAIRKNIKFAETASAQLGEDRVRKEVQNKMPTLAQALWGAQTR